MFIRVVYKHFIATDGVAEGTLRLARFRQKVYSEWNINLSSSSLYELLIITDRELDGAGHSRPSFRTQVKMHTAV